MPEPSVPRPRPASAKDAGAAALRLGSGLGATVTAVTAVGWGDRQSTWRIDLDDGRAIAAQHIDGPDAPRRATRISTVIDRLAANGLAVAQPARVVVDAGRTWVMTPWIAGPTGAELLSSRHAAELVGAMGELSRTLSIVEVDDLDLAGPWDDPSSLRLATTGWLAAVASDLGRPTVRTILAAVERATVTEVAGDGGADGDRRRADPDRPRSGLRHGDFAPINMLAPPQGRLVLVDFEHARRSALPIDVAWWAWVVRYHHPSAWQRLGPTFLAAAGCADSGPARAHLAALALLQLLERAAAAAAGGRPEERRRWIDRIGATAGWDEDRS